jgi:integrase
MIAMLAVAPLRIRNFQNIEIGKSLVYEQGRYLLRFPAEETKTGVEIEIPLPPEFEPYLKVFCSKHRPTLMKQGTGTPIGGSFWIDRGGKKMSEAVLRETIERWTKLKFGKHVWPHLFRDAAATSIAQDDPEHVGVITSLLSHTSIATAKKYYDQSTALQASRSVVGVIYALRTAEIDDAGNEGAF